MGSEDFHAERTARHYETALQRRADNPSEGWIKGEVVEKFKADTNKTGLQKCENAWGRGAWQDGGKALRDALRSQSCLEATVEKALSL